MHTIQSINGLGLPQPWASLIRKPIERDLRYTAKLLTDIDKPNSQDYLARLAERDLRFVSEFLNSLQIPFFFVGWDHKQSTVVQRCGPDRKSVLSLLNHQPVTKRPTAGPDNDRLNQVWQAVGIMLDELRFRDGISFSLSWNAHYERIPEFDFSGYDRQVAWNGLWQSLPLEDRCHISREPPPCHVEPEERAVEPAPPTVEEPYALGIRWHQLQEFNPLREPAWRWNRSFALARHGRNAGRKCDDPATRKASRFLKAILECPQDLEALMEQMPDVCVAHELYVGPADQRLELESRLLARQSSQEVAQRLSISPATVDAYHDTFFDIRACLDAKSYIIKKVICADSGLSSHPLTLEGLAKQVAYFSGPVALNTILPYLKDNGRELARRTGSGETPVHDPLAERIDLLLRAQSLPEDGKTSISLVKATADLIQGLPENRPTQRWTGVFAQIVSPFEGEITSSAGELQAEESADRQVA